MSSGCRVKNGFDIIFGGKFVLTSFVILLLFCNDNFLMFRCKSSFHSLSPNRMPVATNSSRLLAKNQEKSIDFSLFTYFTPLCLCSSSKLAENRVKSLAQRQVARFSLQNFGRRFSLFTYSWRRNVELKFSNHN